MTEESAPLVDPRSAQDISRQLRKLLAGYAPQWMKGDAGADVPEGLSAAIIGIFSRFSEIVIHRLNKTPEKNLLAYLDLLGLSVLPPQPARVPLTFSLAAGSLTDAVVPAGTQVATKPAEGETEPAVFETERELTVVAARLDAALTRDPAQDAYADLSDVIRAAADPGAQVFSAETPLEHTHYVGHERFLSHPALKELRVSFQLAQALTNPKPRQLAWESWDGKTWALLFTSDSGGKVTPAGGVSASDATRALTKGGEVVLTGLPAVPPTSAGGREGRWLRVRLTTKIPPADFKPAGGQAAQLPTVNGVRLSARLERALAAAGAD
ncbi:MAG TPA: hypothetical protein VF570_06805, partial [Pyrinomonadaceae bacterium]